ncbi:MAG: AsmA family protein, partial [Candidatus Omnitrophica bacterium]|nr:AsmA family protein [Candidatus Omnitrophota bacterium]
MNKYAKIAAAVVIIIFVAAFAKDAIIKVSVEKGVELVTGLKLSVGGLHVGIIKPVVSIKNLKLLNPPSFPDRTMVNMPEIYVKYDLPAIVGGTIHLPEVRLALKEFVVVKNSKGELNLDALRTVQAQKKGASPSQDSPGKAPAIKIDSLRLSIGKV